MRLPFLPVGAIVGLLACESPPTPASEAATKEVPGPPERAADPAPARPTLDDLRWARGSFEVALDGTALALPRMPLYENAMTVVPDRNVSRMTITAHAEGGWPKIQLFLFGHRVDQLPLPIALPATHSRGKSVEIRYWPRNDALYSTTTSVGTVFLDKLEGNTVSGRFEGELHPAGGGDPVKLTSGAFEVEIKARALQSRSQPDQTKQARPD